jgi:hypothetical protein
VNQFAMKQSDISAIAPITVAPEWRQGRQVFNDGDDAGRSGRVMGVLQIARRWRSAPDLPDVSKCFSQDALKASMPATTMLLCMGLFSIF